MQMVKEPVAEDGKEAESFDEDDAGGPKVPKDATPQKPDAPQNEEKP